MDKQGWVNRFERLLPAAVRSAVPVRIKEWILERLARPESATPHVLEREHLARDDYERVWQASFGTRPAAERGYFEAHRTRFYELYNALAFLYPDRGATVRVLEIGVSEFSAFHKHFYPNIQLTTLDRPVADHGANAAWGRQVARSDRHYNADLNREVLSPEWGTPPLGAFDLVICTEVIEHLVLHPLDLFEELLGLLVPGGMLYLTTPNFFRRENLQRIARRENPQAAYPRRGENWDAHHHFRELTMGELEGYTAMAGGRVVHRYFSACWDGEAAASLPAQERANLVLVATRD